MDVLQKFRKNRNGYFETSLSRHIKKLINKFVLCFDIALCNTLNLTFSIHVHCFITSQCPPSCVKGLEDEGRIYSSIYEVMILYNNIVEVFVLLESSVLVFVELSV